MERPAVIRSLFAPRTPSEVLAEERAKVLARKPALSLVRPDPRPQPEMFVWRSVADLIPIKDTDR
jgi:hypothetical protein